MNESCLQAMPVSATLCDAAETGIALLLQKTWAITTLDSMTGVI